MVRIIYVYLKVYIVIKFPLLWGNFIFLEEGQGSYCSAHESSYFTREVTWVTSRHFMNARILILISEIMLQKSVLSDGFCESNATWDRDSNPATLRSRGSLFHKKASYLGCFWYQYGGGTEIRTLGTLRHGSFQDCCNQPLCHPSGCVVGGVYGQSAFCQNIFMIL